MYPDQLDWNTHQSVRHSIAGVKVVVSGRGGFVTREKGGEKIVVVGMSAIERSRGIC